MTKITTPAEVKRTPVATPDIWTTFRGELDRMFDRFGRTPFGSFPRLFEAARPFALNPAIEITDDDKAYTLTAELPGLDNKDFEVAVTEDSLVLKGKKRQEKEEKGKNTYVSERSYGAFQRVFALPVGVDRGKIVADFAKGVLTVTMPKTTEAQKHQKKIEIKTR